MYPTSGTKRKSTLLDSSSGSSKKAKLGTSMDDARKLQMELESIEQKLGLLNEKIEKNKSVDMPWNNTPPAPSSSTYEDIDNELMNDLVDVADSESFDSEDKMKEDHTFESSSTHHQPRQSSKPRTKRQPKPANKYPDMLDVETTGPDTRAPAAPRRRPVPRKKIKPVLPVSDWKPILKSARNRMAGKPTTRHFEGAALRECAKILREIMKHPDAWPFLKPVDPVELNIPDYLTVIKQPMDLGTIERNLKEGNYESPELFQRDVKLTFDNAMLYNPVSNEFHAMASDLLVLFDKKFQKVLDMDTPQPGVKKEMLQKTLNALKEERERLTLQIAELDMALNHKSDTDSDDKSPPLRPREQFLMAGDKTCTSHADRCKVCNAVNGLQDKYMAGVIQILSQELNDLKTNAPVCEVDIDSLSPTVLRRLLAYVEDCMHSDMRVTKGPDYMPPITEATYYPINDVKAEGGTRTQLVDPPTDTTGMDTEHPQESSGTASSETSDTSESDSD